MKNLIFILFAFISIKSFGQIPFRNFDDCSDKMFFVTAEENPKFENSGKDIYDYLNIKFRKSKLMKKVNGKILIGIIILEDGEACCKSFVNKTGKEIDSSKIKEIINAMPDWQPARNEGKAIPFLYNLILNVENGKIINQQ